MKRNISIMLCFILLLVSLVQAAPDDTDDDTIRNEFDICPDTARGAILVNPEDNYAYAGCTCEQIKAMVDNECIAICHQDLLEMREGTAGPLVECPQDYCDQTTLMHFLPNGRGICEEGVFTPRDCGPQRQEQAYECVGEGLNETLNYIPRPELPENSRNLDLVGAQASYHFVEQLTYGSGSFFELLVVFEDQSNISVFNASLESEFAQVIPEKIVYGEDETDTLFYYAKWKQPAKTPGKHKLELKFSLIQEGKQRSISQVMAYETFRKPIALESGVLGYDFLTKKRTELNEEEKIYAQGIFDVAQAKGAETAGIPGIALALEHVDISKSIEKTSDSTVFTIHVSPKEVKGLINLTIIEEISKEAAEDITHILFSRQPDHILEEDPLIMWHFEEADEPIDISYEVDRPVEVTGNTIVSAGAVVQKGFPWNIILPLVFIPLIAIIILVLPRARSKL